MTLNIKEYNYSPSVNIIRDKDREINYIPTINGQRSFEQIVDAAQLGTRAFTLVGAYGTGKSTFLWAFAKAIEKGNGYFDHFDYILRGYTQYSLLDFVGDYSSVQTAFATLLSCKQGEALSSLDQHARDLQRNGTALIIRIDEFGKYLEFAAKNNPESDFYFLQQIAELVNDQQRNIVLITTLHQDFSAYAYQLTESQRKEWLKVKGRFREITFNEPAEHLLLIASEKLKDNGYHLESKLDKALLVSIKEAKAFPLKDYFNIEVSENLAPLDLLSGSTLALALQRYGQNERSLFTFLESSDYNGLIQFLNEPNAPFYSLSHVYDYLVYHYYVQLTSHHNPDNRPWRLMFDNIDRVEALLEEDQLILGRHLVKIIGLLNLFGRKSLVIDDSFLKSYCNIALGLGEIDKALKTLLGAKIIRYRKFSNRYVLFEGTDIDIDEAIEEAKNDLPEISSISQYINRTFSFPAIVAKKELLKNGTPRYFEFKLSDEPISIRPKDEIDGFINLVFSTTSSEEAIRLMSESQQEAILYVFFRHTETILEQIHLIEQIKISRSKHEGDRVARKEFDTLYAYYSEMLKKQVLDSFYTIDSSNIKLYYKGEDLSARVIDRKSLNSFLSYIVSDVYWGTPVFKNEMVNKTKVSSPILTARRALLKNICENFGEKDFGYNPKLFPPDKTIYHSLIKANGFYVENEFETYEFSAPNGEDFRLIWELYLEFLEEAKVVKINLQEFVDKLQERPYKLKKGLIDFVLPLFLLVKQSDYSLFNKDGFIPKLNADILDLILKNPAEYWVKSFSAAGIHLSVFNKYRELLNQNKAEKSSNTGFVEMIRPFLSFYVQLPNYSKETAKITKEALNLRKAIAESTDPEKTFFEDFPNALGYSLKDLDQNPQKLERFFVELRQSITDIRSSYNALIQRFEEFLLEEIVGGSSIDFADWKIIIQEKIKGLKPYLVAPHLKVFLQRLNSNLEDKTTWLSSLSHSIIGKQLEDINDEEEIVLFIKFKEWIHELENLTEIESKIASEYIHDALKVEITSLARGLNKRTLSIPKSKQKEVDKVKSELSKCLTGDKEMNIFILARLLNDQMKSDEE